MIAKYVVYVIFILLIGCMCYVWAVRKGSNPNSWFLKGAAAGLVALLIAVFVKKQIKEHKNKK